MTDVPKTGARLVQVGILFLQQGENEAGEMSDSFGVVIPNVPLDAVLTIHEVSIISQPDQAGLGGSAHASFSLVQPFDGSVLTAAPPKPALSLVPDLAIEAPQSGDGDTPDE